MLTVGDDLWLTGPIHNASYVVRSRDQGLTWESVPVVAPPASGEQFVSGVVAGPGGRLVATGSISSDCQRNDDVGNGYREVGFCKRYRPVLYISDDDGASWGQIEPAAMAPPGDTSVLLSGLVVTPDGYLAAGTVKGSDWHVRLWSSPDGETWTLEREIRGDGNAISARQLLTDGETVVLVADEHPCTRPGSDTPQGWVLGSSWLSKLRILSGTSAGDLTVLSPAEHPFAHDPEVIDCELVTATIDAIDEANATTVRAVGAVIGGAITMLQNVEAVEEDDVADPLTAGTQRFTQLIAGEWAVTEIDGVPINQQAELIDIDGAVGLMAGFASILPNTDGTWSQASPERSLKNSGVVGAASTGDALVVAAIVNSDPYRTGFGPPNVSSVAVWRSVVSSGEIVDQCAFEANGRCRYADLSTVAGYPDFTGMDLSGIDLALSDLGEANFSGVNFSGATLWEVAGGDAMFDGANFTGARLERATMGSAVGADFTSANLDGADIADVTGAVFTGTNLQNANVAFTALPAIDGALIRNVHFQQNVSADPTAAYELSLPGLDLSFVNINNALGGPLLEVVSLDGSTLDYTTFYGVDLTAIDATATDLTGARLDEESICPDGLPADDLPLGTCVRAGAP